MGAYVLKFEKGEKSVNIFRNYKTNAMSLLKTSNNFLDIKFDGDRVGITVDDAIEVLKDLDYYIHERNDEFEDGKISESSIENSRKFYLKCSESLDKLIEFAQETKTKDNVILWGEWVKLKDKES